MDGAGILIGLFFIEDEINKHRYRSGCRWCRVPFLSCWEQRRRRQTIKGIRDALREGRK